MNARSVLALLVVLGACSLAGCGSKEAVLVGATLDSPELTVAGNSLVTDVTGSFDLELTLGDRASDPSTVEIGTFSLQRDGAVLLNPLLLATDPTFPIDLGVGKSKHVDVTITNRDGAAELALDLCSAELQIVGTLTDSLVDGSLSVRSALFLPDCP